MGQRKTQPVLHLVTRLWALHSELFWILFCWVSLAGDVGWKALAGTLPSTFRSGTSRRVTRGGSVQVGTPLPLSVSKTGACHRAGVVCETNRHYAALWRSAGKTGWDTCWDNVSSLQGTEGSHFCPSTPSRSLHWEIRWSRETHGNGVQKIFLN